MDNTHLSPISGSAEKKKISFLSMPDSVSIQVKLLYEAEIFVYNNGLVQVFPLVHTGCSPA